MDFYFVATSFKIATYLGLLFRINYHALALLHVCKDSTFYHFRHVQLHSCSHNYAGCVAHVVVH